MKYRIYRRLAQGTRRKAPRTIPYPLLRGSILCAMKPQTELAIRSIAGTDSEIEPKMIEQALDILRGNPLENNADLVHVLRYKEVANLLHVHKRTLDYYIRMGYLDKVYGGGKRAIGISRASFNRFVQRKVYKRDEG